MVVGETSVYFDPYDVEINADPYPTYERLREEAPLYYNERYDFWALARHEDVQKALATGRSSPAVGATSSTSCKSRHRNTRRASSCGRTRPCTPSTAGSCHGSSPQSGWRRSRTRSAGYCVRCLDPLVGSEGFDVITELASMLPMRVIGMLLGIPEEDQVAVREQDRPRPAHQAGRADAHRAVRGRRPARCSPTTSNGAPSIPPTT